MLVFWLSESSDQYRAFKDFFEPVSGDEVIQIRHNAMSPQEKVHDPALIAEAYKYISSKIDAAADIRQGPASLRDAIGFVNVGDKYFNNFNRLSPVAVNLPTWPCTVAMLVLAYPEIQWVFTNTGLKGTGSQFFQSCHIYTGDPGPLLELRSAGFTPLFDASGLRNTVRNNIRHPQDPGQVQLDHLRLRDSVAAAIDDEGSYAYFVAHTAYKMGFRTHLVTTFRMLSTVFGPNAPSNPALLSLEDISLNFSDRPEGVSLADLHKRDEALPRLLDLKRRIFVTYGYENTMAQEENEAWVGYLKKKRIESSTIYKPISGMFELSREIAPSAPAFGSWMESGESDSAAPKGHGVPGRLLFVAESLIARAAALMRDKSSVQDCIHGAVLAGDALELVGNRVPTTAIEALSLKHELEVSAECMFPGLQSALEVRSRIKAVQREVAFLSKRFHWATREVSMLDTELGAVNRITTVIQENNRFDEEQECLKIARKLRLKLWLARKKGFWNSLWAFPLSWVRGYVDTLVASLGLFAVALLGWVALATLVFRFSAVEPPPVPFGQPAETTTTGWALWATSFYHAVENFISAHPPDDVHHLTEHHSPFLLVFIPFLVLLGFVHLGIFVAYLYSTISRKSG